MNICSDEWHKEHEHAASHLFGFGSWRETKNYMWAFWPELVPPTQNELECGHAVSEYEMCLMTKMRFRRAFKMETLALMWDRD